MFYRPSWRGLLPVMKHTGVLFIVMLAAVSRPAAGAEPARSSGPPSSAHAPRVEFRRALKARMAQVRRDLAAWRALLAKSTRDEERNALLERIVSGEREWRQLRAVERRARRPGRLAPPPEHRRT